MLIAALRPALVGLLVMVPVVLGVELALGGREPSVIRLVAAIAAGVLSYTGAILTFERGALADLRLLLQEVRAGRAASGGDPARREGRS